MPMDAPRRARGTGPILVLVGLLFVFSARGLPAQSEAPDRSTAEGVFTEEQAERGEELYDRVCAACHFTSQFSRSFMDSWTGSTVFSFYRMLRQTMPYDRPGSLSPQQYADVVAYLFDLNGFPTGSSPLEPEEEALRNVLIERSQNR